VTRSLEDIRQGVTLAHLLLGEVLKRDRDMTSDGIESCIYLAVKLLLGEDECLAPTEPYILEPGSVSDEKTKPVHVAGFAYTGTGKPDPQFIEPNLPPSLDRRKKPDTQAETTGG